VFALATIGTAVAIAAMPGDPSSGDGGSITVTTSAKTVPKHGRYNITVAGQVPASGELFLLWTDARRIKGGCPVLGTEGSYIDAGFGGELIHGSEIPPGPFSQVAAERGGAAHLEYRFCGYLRFVGKAGDTELGAGAVVAVK
jgi:hypothetical protein